MTMATEPEASLLYGKMPSRLITASPVTSTSFSSISSSSALLTSGRSVSLETKRAVSSGPTWNFGSTILWIRAEEYSATSDSSFRSSSVNSPFVPAVYSLLRVWMAPMVIEVLRGTVSIERTSNPVVVAMDVIMGAWLSVFLKKTGSPVLITLPTMPVPRGIFSWRSLASISLNLPSFFLSSLQRVGE